MWLITDGYCRGKRSAEVYDVTLHDLWYVYYQGAKSIAHSSPNQEKWAFNLLQIKYEGILTKKGKEENDSVEIASTSGGRIWEDLPFFTTDMMEYWAKDCVKMDASQRLNFSHFLAKLASTGLDNDRLCRIALVVFRETFETVRPIGSNSGEGGEENLSIAVLLPVAYAWVLKAGRKIILLCDRLWNDCSSDVGQFGPGFVASPWSLKTSAAFNPWRWLYWLKRLGELTREAKQAGLKDVAEVASEAIADMLTHVEYRETSVLREFEVEPDLIENQYRYSVNRPSWVGAENGGDELIPFV